MSNIFPFIKHKSVMSEDTPEWSNQHTDISLSDTLNTTYNTAVGENETQYLSVLETSQDDTLEGLDNLSNQKLIIQDTVGLEGESENNFVLTDSGEQQVAIFNVEGSDEIYGIQLAQDEQGNIHKYQFQFRKTEDGQLEAMPETVQLLPNEEDQETTVESTKEVENCAENEVEEEIFETPVYIQEATEDVTLLPDAEEDIYENEEVNIYSEQDTEITEDDSSNQVMVYIKKQIDNEEQQDDFPDEVFDEGYEDTRDNMDIKPEPVNIKQELLLEKQYDIHEDQENESAALESQEENLNQDFNSEAGSCSSADIHNENVDTIIEYQHFDAQNIEVYEDLESLDAHPTSVGEEQYEELFIEEKNYDEQGAQKTDEDGNMIDGENGQAVRDSDTEEYEIVEGLPVTADEEISESNSSTIYQEPEIIYTEPEQISQPKEKAVKATNILKQPMYLNKTNDTKKKNIVYYMVSNTEQKENLNALSNPRSLLKNNLEKVSNDETLKRIQREKLLEKRYARSKEAIQAKMFHNFINKTTIPHAPVRQTRLPRKQKIKPVDTRRNEEIIVQEVMVSSNGFVESISDRLKSLDKFEITSIVELTDSDEEYKPKNGTKKKKKHKKIKSATIGISDDYAASVIEILQSDDEGNQKTNLSKSKKDDNLKRERRIKLSKSGDESSPHKVTSIVELTDSDEEYKPKNGTKKKKKHKKTKSATMGFSDDSDASVIEILHSGDEENQKSNRGRSKKYDNLKRERRKLSKSGDESSPHKKSRTEDSDSDVGKKEFSCLHCPKSFPSQNSLATHIQHHNLENGLLNSNKKIAIEYKHKCDKCKETFKNGILLKRHVCKIIDTMKYKCGVCSKKFKEIASFNSHKKSHIKENLVKSTSTVTISPKKFLPKPSTSGQFKLPTGSFKCKICSKVSSTQSLLSVHEKTHSKFACTTCKTSFNSKLLLDAHMRSNCVKMASPKNKRLSFSVRRSFVHSPSHRSSVLFRRSNQALKQNLPKTSTIISKDIKNMPSTSKIKSNTLNVPNTSKDNQLSTNRLNPNLNSSKKINLGLSTSSMKRHLDIEICCDTCPMKFGSYTNLFTHKVKIHGLSTTDAEMLKPPENKVHTPYKTHGGIPANTRLNKAFQEIRKNFALLKTEPPDSPRNE